MRLTQGAFSFLPDLTDEQIKAQVAYALSKNWAVSVEYSDDPHPRNAYWNLWGLPLFDIKDPAAVMFELAACKKAKPNYYIKLTAFDNTRGTESSALSFIAQRPAVEPGFKLTRTDGHARQIVYTIESYACDKPSGARY
uniref:Multifunctional fusion protein n=1 Tax=Haptophyceae sp. NIES-3900 TaxID=2748608 RepID=A0A7R7AHM9_9EUKA|nr:ribulose-1,5-bisphosphate carboxylase/oxygenase small subunit [Haptophyceae sp. NIES-3900]